MTVNLGRTFSFGLRVRYRRNTLGKPMWWRPDYVWCLDHNEVSLWWCWHHWFPVVEGEVTLFCHRCDRER